MTSSTSNMAGLSSAPCLEIAPRDVVAVEHPMIVKNIDNALKTFGVGDPFEKVGRCPSRDKAPTSLLPCFRRTNWRDRFSIVPVILWVSYPSISGTMTRPAFQSSRAIVPPRTFSSKSRCLNGRGGNASEALKAHIRAKLLIQRRMEMYQGPKQMVSDLNREGTIPSSF